MATISFISFCVVVLLAVGVGLYWPNSRPMPTVTLTRPTVQADDNGGEC